MGAELKESVSQPFLRPLRGFLLYHLCTHGLRRGLYSSAASRLRYRAALLLLLLHLFTESWSGHRLLGSIWTEHCVDQCYDLVHRSINIQSKAC